MTFDKVMFGMWLCLSALEALLFAVGCAAGEPNFDDLALAFCGVIVCQLYWRIWHEKAPELYINIYRLPDGNEVRTEEWK